MKDDVISRQTAIDYVDDVPYIKMHPNIGLLWKAWIEQLPSAQPESEEFEWCHDCKEYDQERHCCHRWTKVIRQTVDELKQATVDAVPVIRCKECKYYGDDGDCWHEWANDGRIYYQSVINEPNPDDYCSMAERK